MHNSKISISIIVPIYNTARFLNKCIESIVNQTYRNIEIILINDGSTDDSLDICKAYASWDSRITIIDKENEGVATARNVGLEIATGDYIGFVDSDDYIAPDMYENMLEAIRSNAADIAECGYYLCDENYAILYDRQLQNDITIGSNNCLHEYLNKSNTENFAWNKLYRKESLRGLRYSDYKYSEDYLFNVKAFFKCNKKVAINVNCYYHVANHSSATRQGFNINRLDTLNAAKEALEFIEENKPEYLKYVIVYILNYVRKFYLVIMDNKLNNKEKLISYLLDEFHYYYPKIQTELETILKYRKTYYALWLFDKSPKLYYIVEKLRK